MSTNERGAMPAPDYSEGVPRKVVDERRAALGVSLSDPLADTAACSHCSDLGNLGLVGIKCMIAKSCPGVFVPIIEDEPPLPRDFELERAEPEPSTGGARERVKAFVRRRREVARIAGAHAHSDEIHVWATGEALLESDLRALLAELDGAKLEAERQREAMLGFRDASLGLAEDKILLGLERDRLKADLERDRARSERVRVAAIRLTENIDTPERDEFAQDLRAALSGEEDGND